MAQEPTRDYDTQSLTASVTEYPIENGRTYHKYHEGSYMFPNDEREMDRLDMQHHMCKMLTGGRLFFAPIINPRNIIDIGTGSGIWPIEMSQIFPNTQITGTDLSPCQPTEVPENVHFIVDDITEDEWLWDRNSLDYIRTGHLSASLPSYKELLRKMYSHLRPNGWAEIHEFDTMVRCDDGTMPPLDDSMFSTYPFQDWCDLQIQSGQVTDPPRQVRVAHRLARGMREMGFVDVQERIYKVPVNRWPTDPHLRSVGQWMESNILEGLSGWSYKPLRLLGWSKAEIEVFLVNVRKRKYQLSHSKSWTSEGRFGSSSHQPHAERQSAQLLEWHHCLMSLGRCAYRHATASSSSTFTDHLWISDELLASTFRRFVSGQRRYESRVPGPLEARRRLAKRRNTALASIPGSGPGDDIASLLGKNGREHMKWSEPDKGFDIPFSSPPLPPQSMSLFDHFLNPDAFDSGDMEDTSPDSGRLTREEFFGDRLHEYQTVNDLRGAIRELEIDLRQEPSSSRLLFDHLLAQSLHRGGAVDELALFLDDSHLNIPGARNYLRLVEHSMSPNLRSGRRRALFNPVLRALELGVVPRREICAIISCWSDWGETRENCRKARRELMKVYREIWGAIGKCDVYGHQHLEQSLVDAWLGICWENGTVGYLRLAKDILLATDYGLSRSRSWLPKFVARLLSDPSYSLPTPDMDIIIESLKPFDVDVISNSLIRGTDALFTSNKTRYLRRWGKCLARLHDASELTSSEAWTRVRSERDPRVERHLVLRRLWMLHTMRRFSQRRASNLTKTATKHLYRHYESLRRYTKRKDKVTIDLWTSLIHHISRMKIPFNLEAIADDLRTGKPMTYTMRTRLRQFQKRPLSFSNIFADVQAYNAARHAFGNNVDSQIRQVDVGSPDFRDWAIQTARTGDSSAVFSILRLLRSHTPIKIALSRAWPLPDTADKAPIRYDPRPRNAGSPDPHAVLDMIHALATSVACAKQLSPQRAYRLVRWIYIFLYRHGAPIQSPMARALYYAGIVRFRKEKGYISPAQNDYIWDVVRRAVV
ncbi:class I SAM-dependent methyltransferase [Aspergillus mulundensis]|uniref:Methyltransferase domain-containing protein n=1 Tax=Aspergillus mulundensis TaxID=1810919 RepID=A0A3D8RWT4_9EURO|nr:Uncharacterized protein DSM5745_05391 [Aspergillus mulundensis]RDW78539.1 Uncharacterized protein DSM5745_05391 [Aspergillus mulundensis]